MRKFLIQYISNGTAHEDIHVHLEEFSLTADSYFLADNAPYHDIPVRVETVLIAQLEAWKVALQNATETNAVFFPYAL